MHRIIILLLLLAFSTWPAYCETEGKNLKIGVVDSEKLFDQYPGAQEATKKITDAQETLRKELADSEKIYAEFEKQKKSEAEKLTKQKELQAKIDAKAQETKKMIETLSSKIEDDILQSIKKVAAEKWIEIVFDKRAVLYGGSDITDTVSDYLKKKVPIAEENTKKK